MNIDELETLHSGCCLTEIASFPPEVALNWTLDELLDRTLMVAQFNCGTYTFAEAMLRAFEGVTCPDSDGFDDDDAGFQRFLAERDRRALACRDAVMRHLKSKRRPAA